jgi:hypothetical protein
MRNQIAIVTLAVPTQAACAGDDRRPASGLAVALRSQGNRGCRSGFPKICKRSLIVHSYSKGIRGRDWWRSFRKARFIQWHGGLLAFIVLPTTPIWDISAKMYHGTVPSSITTPIITNALLSFHTMVTNGNFTKCNKGRKNLVSILRSTFVQK